MKHLKVFELYVAPEQVDDMDDLLLPFSDMGFKVNNNFYKEGAVTLISIGKGNVKYLDLKDDLERLKEYIIDAFEGKINLYTEFTLRSDKGKPGYGRFESPGNFDKYLETQDSNPTIIDIVIEL